MFEVRLTHDEQGRVDSIVFEGAEFNISSTSGIVRVWLDDEARMNWHRVKVAVDEEEAAEGGDANTPFLDEEGYKDANAHAVRHIQNGGRCPICGVPLDPGEKCGPCQRDLRCDP